MRAKTIGQYIILKWLYREFVPGSVKVTFDGENEATITDANNDRATVRFDKETGEVYLE